MVSAPDTRYSFLAHEVADRDAAGFVCVGDRSDPDLRYLTRFSGPDRDYAFVFVDGSPILCAPATYEKQAGREFPGSYVYGPDDLRADTPGERAAEVLDAFEAEGTVLVPQDVPHDAALFLEQAGFDLESTDAVARERAEKSPDEVDCIRAAQDAAATAMARAESILARAEGGPRSLTYEGDPLTTGLLRREVNAVLAREGADPARNTVVAAGKASADLHFQGDLPIKADDTVIVDLAPRGPHGYHGSLTRTFVVDSEGGWDRRAYLAVESAQDAGLAEIAPGVEVSAVHEETAAEVGAYGFPAGYDRKTGFTHGTGHGVGLAPRERPDLTGDSRLRAGHVITVEPGVYDPTEGGVRLGDAVLVTDDGYETLVDYPRSLVPSVE